MTLYHHHPWTGQSLADGVSGEPPITTVARYPSNTFRAGPSDWAPNTASVREQPGVIIPDAIYAARLDSDIYVQGGDAAGGSGYLQLKKGTNVYNNVINNVTTANNRATGPSAGTFVVDAIHIIHGHYETNNGGDLATYLGYLAEWQADYEADITAITGQADLLAVISQTSAWVNSGNNQIARAQLEAHRTNPDIILACSDYASGGIGSVHQSAAGYAHLGEYHARAFLGGRDWQPLSPRDITIAGRHIVAQFHVPTPPLVLDNTVHVPQANYGFGYTDDTSSAAIESVQVRPDGRSLLVTLDQEPTGTNPMLGYGTLGTAQGGNLRDSDPSLSIADNAAIPNWGVLFLDPITPRRPRWSTGRASGLL